MSDLTEDQIQAFLKDLSKISRKHRIVVEACSCCEGINLKILRNLHDEGYTSVDTRYVGWDKYWEAGDE